MFYSSTRLTLPITCLLSPSLPRPAICTRESGFAVCMGSRLPNEAQAADCHVHKSKNYAVTSLASAAQSTTTTGARPSAGTAFPPRWRTPLRTCSGRRCRSSLSATRTCSSTSPPCCRRALCWTTRSPSLESCRQGCPPGLSTAAHEHRAPVTCVSQVEIGCVSLSVDSNLADSYGLSEAQADRMELSSVSGPMQTQHAGFGMCQV